MRSVLISMQPQWCAKVANEEKPIEVRKTRPKLELPFKCYIYCTAAAPYLVYGDVFDGVSFVPRYTVTHGRSRQEADAIWGVMNGKVIGEFVCDRFVEFVPTEQGVRFSQFPALRDTCLSLAELRAYLGNKTGYGWHISNLVIYDTPKPLANFGIVKAPQSWCYVKEVA